MKHRPDLDRARRQLLGATGGLWLLLQARPAAAVSAPETLQGMVRAWAGGRPVTAGRVVLEVPPLVENGNVVPLTISVDSPMNASERVRAIHVFAQKNPQPHVAVFRFGPRAGRAVLSTRIRLADSQTVVAVCEMSDGSFWSGSAEAVVTVSACTEGI